MKCEEVQRTIPLLLYGELSFDEEESCQQHIDSCAACTAAVEREQTLHRALNQVELKPTPELLDRSRRELWRNLSQRSVAGMRATPSGGWWQSVRDMFQLRLHAVPAGWQPAGALALIAMGFFAARVAPTNFGAPINPQISSAGVMEGAVSRVRSVEPVSRDRVQLVVDETRQRVLSGNLQDEAIQKLLLAAAKDASDPGIRVESVDVLKNRADSAEVRSALLAALQHDPNPGVRLKALDGLQAFASDPDTRRVLTQAVLKDQNPGVRTQAIDLLVQHKSDTLVGTLQELMRTENNGYVRMRCQRALSDLKASPETF